MPSNIFLIRVTCAVFLCISAFSLGACDTNEDTGESSLPESVRALDSGRFSFYVEGDTSVVGALSGNACYGRLSEDTGPFYLLFVSDEESDLTGVIALQGPPTDVPSDERSYSIRRSGTDQGGRFEGVYSTSAQTYRSLSGGMFLFGRRNSTQPGQMHFAARVLGGTQSAFPTGSFKAEPCDNFAALFTEQFPNGYPGGKE